MHIIVTSAIIVNIFSIIVLLLGLFCNFEQPKNKAIFGYCVVGALILYIITLSIATIYKLIVKPDLYCIPTLLCVISPFVIGKLVRFETLKKYTIIQIMCFIVSLLALATVF
jgi:hypothetical protein